VTTTRLIHLRKPSRHLLSILLVNFVIVGPSTGLADQERSPLRQALARSASGPVYIYDVHYASPDFSADYRVDPSQPVGARVIVSTPARESWSLDFIEQVADMDEFGRSNFLCSDFASNIPDDARLIYETDLSATYEFEPVPEDEDDEDVFPHLTGQVTVDKLDPAILKFQMVSPKPFKPHWLLFIRRMEMKVSCGRLPDGRTHVKRLSSDVEGTAALKSISSHETWQVGSYEQILQ